MDDMEKPWKITTTNYKNDLAYYIRKDIKANKDNSGYWKQSIVCRIAAHAGYCMKSAWGLFNMYLLELEEISIEDFRKVYNHTFKLN